MIGRARERDHIDREAEEHARREARSLEGRDSVARAWRRIVALLALAVGLLSRVFDVGNLIEWLGWRWSIAIVAALGAIVVGPKAVMWLVARWRVARAEAYI